MDLMFIYHSKYQIIHFIKSFSSIKSRHYMIAEASVFLYVPKAIILKGMLIFLLNDLK
jgi:hypothetical protein